MKLKHILDRPTAISLFEFEPTKNVRPLKHIPWMASPVAYASTGEVNDQSESHEPKTVSPESSEINGGEGHMTVIERDFDQHHAGRQNGPIFKRHHESTTIELFYDLFFVANLATFTDNHEIDTREALASYLGFFAIMWFTWFQTSIFDVRFGTDSAFARICKACSFGVMTGFAIVGPLFDTNDVASDTRGFRTMAIILMASRLILMLQYITVWIYVRSYQKVAHSLMFTIMLEFVSAMVFLGTFFAFKPDQDSKAYIGWFVMIAVEAVVMIAISAPPTSALTFRGTHLVERIGLLTLIIMGEGIIGVAKSVTVIMKASDVIDAGTAGVVICSVLIIYFIWMLYYDQIEADRFAAVRQPIWTLLHFGLHVSILLTVEGSAQFILWFIANDNASYFSKDLTDSFDRALNNEGTLINGTIYAYNLNITLHDIKHRFRGSIALPDYSSEIREISQVPFTTDGYNDALTISGKVIVSVIDWVLTNFGIEAPGATETLSKRAEASASNSETDAQENNIAAISAVFNTVYIYFFSAAGCFLVLLGVMYWFGKKHKTLGEMISVWVRIFVGIGLALFATMYVPDHGFSNTYENYTSGPWILPTIMLTFFSVIVADNFLVWMWNTSIKRRNSSVAQGSDEELNTAGHGSVHGSG